METPRTMPDHGPDPEEKPRSLYLRRFLERLPKTGSEIPWRPLRRILLLLLLILGAVALWRAAQRGFQGIGPGFVGVCANRFTGSLEELSPGTHFRPAALYQIHPVRVSDQLLSDDTLTVTTKEGVIARLTVQARWAIDRKGLLAKWSALPGEPARELVGPVLFAAFRTSAPRYEVMKLISEKREELAEIAGAAARDRLAGKANIQREVMMGNRRLD